MNGMQYVDCSVMKRSFMFDIRMDQSVSETSKEIYENKIEVIGDLKGFLDFLEIGNEIIKLNLMLTKNPDLERDKKIKNQMRENFSLLREFFGRN